jgi:hypothetical protein
MPPDPMPPNNNDFDKKVLMEFLASLSGKLDMIVTKLDSIEKNSTTACTKVDGIERNNLKIVIALIGVIAAQVGVKLVGSPWYIDLSVAASCFSGIFLGGTLIVWWKEFSIQQKLFRILVSLFTISNAVIQIFVYHPGFEPAPMWHLPYVHIFLSAIALSAVWAGWKLIPRNNKSCK